MSKTELAFWVAGALLGSGVTLGVLFRVGAIR